MTIKNLLRLISHLTSENVKSKTSVFVTVTSIGGIYILWRIWKGIAIRRKLPRFPGFYYPYLGNFNFAIRGSNGVELELLKQQRALNSDAITISDPHLKTYAVVLTDMNLIKECFVRNSEFTSARIYSLIEKLDSFSESFWTPQYNIVGSSGKIWHDNRRRALRAFRELGVGKNRLEELINIESDYLMGAISTMQGTTKECFSYLFATATTNIICQLNFALRFPYESKEFQSLYKGIRAVLDRKVVLNYQLLLPAWIRKLPGIRNQEVEDFLEGIKKCYDFAESEMKMHQQMFKENSNDYDVYQEDCMLKMLVKHFESEPSPISKAVTIAVLVDMFLAGTDTTSTTLEWAVFFLSNHPGVQKILKKEIDENISTDSIVFSDMEKLPLCHAFLLETLRYSAVVPFSFPHVTTKDISAGNYRFPKGTILISSAFCVQRDKNIFKNPDCFDINNFLENGRVISSDSLVLFSIGPRICIGEKIARMESFVFITNMVKRFTFTSKLPKHFVNEDDANVGIVRSPKHYELSVAVD